MFREIIYHEKSSDFKSVPYKPIEGYQIRCNLEEGFQEISERKLNSENYYNPKSFYQSTVISSCIGRALEKSFGKSCKEIGLTVFGQVWENERGLTNQILFVLERQKTINWMARSWLLNLLTDNFEPQKHFEKAFRLGLVDNHTDPHELGSVLLKWKNTKN